LVFGQHAERDTSFHAERTNAAHHVEHGIERGTVFCLPPCRAHAEAIGASLARLGRDRKDLVLRHQIDAIELDLAVMRRLQSSGQPPVLMLSRFAFWMSFGSWYRRCSALARPTSSRSGRL
jgi:hypothetical protein